MDLDGKRVDIVESAPQRDAGKRYRIRELSPLEAADYALRVLSALNLPDWSDMELLLAAPDTPEIEETLSIEDRRMDVLWKMLQSCDPSALKQVIVDALNHVEISPDPRHPDVWRPLHLDSGSRDIEETRTLLLLISRFVSLNIHQE